MTEFVFLAKLEDLEPKKAIKVQASGRPVALCMHEGQVHAFDDRCPHRAFSLAAGFVDGPYITCPWHDWCFNFATGQGDSYPAMTIEKFEVEIRGDEIFGKVPADPRIADSGKSEGGDCEPQGGCCE